MYQVNEIVTFVLAVAVAGFALYQRCILAEIPHVRLLAASFLCWCACWTFTIVEGFAAPAFFNGTEHAAACAAAMLFTLWLHRTLSTERTTP